MAKLRGKAATIGFHVKRSGRPDCAQACGWRGNRVGDGGLFADAKVRENFAEQVIGSKFARNAGKRVLREPEFLGQ